MYQHIEFLSQANMQNMMAKPDSIAISITSSAGKNININGKFREVLYLKFDNIENLHSRLKRFSQEDALKIYDLVKRHEQDGVGIYVNCQLGKSRSAAVALFLSEYYKTEMKQDTSEHVPIVYQFLKRIFKREDNKTQGA